MKDSTHSLPNCQKQCDPASIEIKPPGLLLPGSRPSLVGGDQGEPLPCLYSNNSIQPSADDKNLDTVKALSTLLTPYHKRQAHTLFSNVERLINKEALSINHVAFLTLTFPDNVTDHREAYRRFRSMNTNFLSSWAVGSWLCVKERQKRGAWHYHLIVALKDDIKTGVNFEEFEQGNYRSAGSALRSLWKELRTVLPEYGFGRSELMPVRSNAEAMGRYVGKYISKHMGQRTDQDKGVRLVNYSRNWVKNSIRFAWNTENSHEWRRKLALFAEYIGCNEIYQLSEKLGSCWAYRYAEEIQNIDHIRLEKTINARVEGKDLVFPVFESNTVKNLVSKKASRESAMVKNLTIHTGKTDQQRRTEQASRRMVQLMTSGTKDWLTAEKKMQVQEGVKNSREEAPLIEAKRIKDSLIRKKQAIEGLAMVDQSSTIKERKTEGVPF